QHRPPGDDPWLHDRRRLADRHPGHRAEWRQDRQELPGRCWRTGHRRQGIPGQLADRRRPGARDTHADRRRYRQAAPHRGRLFRARAPVPTIIEENRLNMTDTLQKFLFENASVRGELVDVSETWRHVLARRDYPKAVKMVLGDMLAAAALLSANLKFNGAIVMQIHGDGPL